MTIRIDGTTMQPVEELTRHRLSSCEGKQAFDDFALAEQVARRRRKRGRIGAAYKCIFCRKWHIGRSPR